MIHTLKRLFGLGWHHPKAFIAAILLTLASGLIWAGIFHLMEDLFMFFGANIDEHATPEQILEAEAQIQQASHVSTIVFSAIIPAALLSYFAWFTGQWVANAAMMRLRQTTIFHIVELELSFHSNMSRGDLISRMSADMERTQNLLQLLYGKVLQRPVEALGIIGYLFYLEWRLAAALFLGLFPIFILLKRIFGRTRKRSERARKSMAATLVNFDQITSGIRIIKAMGSGKREVERYQEGNEKLFKDNMRVAKTRAQGDAITYAATLLIIGGFFYLGPKAVAAWNVNPWILGTFFVALTRIMQSLRTAQRSWAEAVEQAPCAERIFELIDRQPQLCDKTDAIPCPLPKQHINLENISFRYTTNDELVINNLSLTIPVGATVALVGESGAGKSTLLDLLPRLYDVNEGRICFDDVDIRDVTHDSLIHHFGIVQQEGFLFNDTVYNNIAYGKPNASEEDIYAAAKRAHIHDTILSLEGGDGYQTNVGDRGERLSGGQRQRVAIARALLRDAPILLLDEPTSALDAESERHVQEALSALMQGRTSVVVAHRLSTIQNADIIYVIGKEEHSVIEHGSHEELLTQNGIYAQLVKMQQLKT